MNEIPSGQPEEVDEGEESLKQFLGSRGISLEDAQALWDGADGIFSTRGPGGKAKVRIIDSGSPISSLQKVLDWFGVSL